mgnify:CR=1 FL=1
MMVSQTRIDCGLMLPTAVAAATNTGGDTLALVASRSAVIWSFTVSPVVQKEPRRTSAGQAGSLRKGARHRSRLAEWVRSGEGWRAEMKSPDREDQGFGGNFARA